MIKIECPQICDSIDTRKDNLKKSIEKWIYSESLINLINIFGGKIPSDLNFYEYISYINEFAEVWNYRKKQEGSAERWAVVDDELALKYKDVILETAEELGLMGRELSKERADYVLPLGGARLTNYTRPQMAKQIVDLNEEVGVKIVALTGKRPINEIEIPFLQDYAPLAKTEYEAMCGGIEKAFEMEKSDYLETSYMTNNINLQWSIREYIEKIRGNEIFVLAAPSSDSNRRANSYDTFMFFLEKFNVCPGNRILLVTSDIYVPFQLLKFIPIALEKNIYVDCVGVKGNMIGNSFNRPSNYCQEIKATINAIKVVADLYWK